MKAKLTFWLVFGLSVALGALIWIGSRRFTGNVEPWDPPGYYWHIGLLVAGFIPALLSPQRFWLWPLGVLLGQVIIFVPGVIQGPPAPLWPLGIVFLVVYSIVAFVGSFLGWASRRLFGRMLVSSELHHDA